MARKRQIDPEICVDEDMGALSRDARLFYILSWTHAEDTGVLELKPRTLKMKIFPYDNDIDIIGLIEELLNAGRYILYKDDEDVFYLFIKNFHKHQIIQHPSKPKFPLPPEPYRSTIKKNILQLATPELLSHTTHIALTYQYNRVELSRVEKNRVESIDYNTFEPVDNMGITCKIDVFDNLKGLNQKQKDELRHLLCTNMKNKFRCLGQNECSQVINTIVDKIRNLSDKPLKAYSKQHYLKTSINNYFIENAEMLSQKTTETYKEK